MPQELDSTRHHGTCALKWLFFSLLAKKKSSVGILLFLLKKRALYITNFVKVMTNRQQNFVSSNSVCNHFPSQRLNKPDSRYAVAGFCLLGA